MDLLHNTTTDAMVIPTILCCQDLVCGNGNASVEGEGGIKAGDACAVVSMSYPISIGL